LKAIERLEKLERSPSEDEKNKLSIKDTLIKQLQELKLE
jgi:hypothetical protein